MAKLSDKEVQKFLDEVNTGPGGVRKPQPAFQKYREHFMRDMDFNDFKNFSPEELIRAARTQEELFVIREEYLSKLPNHASGEPWWNLYHKKRLELGQKPSLYGVVADTATGKQRGMWGVPLDPQVVMRQGAPSDHVQHRSVDRRLHSRFATWEQITGQRRLFNVVETGDGHILRRWKGLKAPVLPSNAPPTALVFDIETTGLLGKDANIISLGMMDTKTGRTSGLYAAFEQGRKYPGKVGEVVSKWQKTVAAEGIQPISERVLLERFLNRIERTGAKEALMGYNIKQFDIPKLYETAKKYGLQKRFETAVKGKTVVDVAEYAQAFLSRQLGSKYIGWEAGTVEELGLKPLGWQLEVVAESLGFNVGGMAHEAKADVKMTRFIWDKLKDPEKWAKVAEEEFKLDSYLTAVKRQTGRDLRRITSKMGEVDYSFELFGDESKYLRTFREHLEELYPTKAGRKIAQEVGSFSRAATEGAETLFGRVKKLAAKPLPLAKITKGRVTAGRALSYSAAFVGTNLLFPGNFWQNSFSSVAWEGARHAAKSMGAGGWKQWAAAAAGSLAANAVWFGASSLSRPNDVAVKEAIGGLEFSGHDDVYNVIPGLGDEGMRQGIRRQYTDFGSGYQGLNPWLNPNYNNAEDIERHKIMRASKLGLSEAELYSYFTKKEEASQYLQATAHAGSALHLVEEAKALKQGRVAAAEELVYDPTNMVTGHIDVTYKSGSPADIKTVSSKRFKQVQQSGAFSKHVHQLNWYMHQKNAQTGYLEYVNRDNTSQRLTLEVGYDPQMHEKDMQKLMRVRRRVQHEIEAGLLNEAMLPKTASLETLKVAAAEEAGQMLEYSKKIPYLEKVFRQEMDYLNSISAKRSYRRSERDLQFRKDLLAIKGQRFSGKDDNYNTIEGLRHGGIAEDIRKTLTAFGSGFDLFKPYLQNELLTEGRRMFVGRNSKTYAHADFVQAFSGRDDDYNFIEGLKHGGVAGDIRQLMTEFGSGWDPMRGLAKALFGGAKDAYKQLRKTSKFQQALKSGKEVKHLGEGAYGSAWLMQAEIEGQTFQYVKKDLRRKNLEGLENFLNLPSEEKRIASLESEFALLAKTEERISPSPYMFDPESGSLYMEFMEGKTLESLEYKVPGEALGKLRAEVDEAAKLGVFNPDIHGGNVLYSEATGQLSWIDFGLAKAAEKPTEKWVQSASLGMREAIEKNIVTQDVSAAASKATGEFFDDWGGLVSKGSTKHTESDSAIALAKTLKQPLSMPKFDAEAATERMTRMGTKPIPESSRQMPKPFVGSNTLMLPTLKMESPSVATAAQVAGKIAPPRSISPGMGAVEEVARESGAESMLRKPNIDTAILPVGSLPIQTKSAGSRLGANIPPDGIRNPPDAGVSSSDARARAKRIQKFRRISTDAVGIGHRAAHNAGRKHSRFKSIDPANSV